MKNKIIARQLIEFHKSTFDNTFDSLTALQQQTENMIQAFLMQAGWLPSEGREVINQWVDIYKKGQIDFKKTMDENYAKVEEYFSTATAEPKVKTSQKK